MWRACVLLCCLVVMLPAATLTTGSTVDLQSGGTLEAVAPLIQPLPVGKPQDPPPDGK